VRSFNVNAAIREGGNKRHSIGHGLSLYVRGASALWTSQFRDRTTKRLRQTSLGSAKGFEAMSLTEAREAHMRHRISLLDGTAPAPRTSVGKTFGDALLAYLDARAGAWKGGMQGGEADAHRRLLELDLANMPLSQIGTAAVRKALAQWDGTSTSGKMRTKIASVIDFAKASEWFKGDNPAANKTMGKLLPTEAKTKHHDAMLASDIPAFMAGLATFNTPAARALQLTILTAARTSETRFATWSEIDTAGAIWSRPAEHMKEGIAHSVPLTAAALALLGPRGAPSELIFKSPTGIALHGGAMQAYLKGRGCTVHGMRSAFTDWAAEAGYDSELREMALAHATGDATERAYRRTDLIAKRRPMMQAWSDFATGA
jgi:integrase